MGAVRPRMKRGPAGVTEPVTRLDRLGNHEGLDTIRWTTRTLTTLNIGFGGLPRDRNNGVAGPARCQGERERGREREHPAGRWLSPSRKSLSIKAEDTSRRPKWDTLDE